TIEEKGSVRDYEIKLRKKTGQEMECLITATIRYGNDGGISGYQGIIKDITEQKKMEEELRTLSVMDDLTGLYNRRGFFTLSQQQMKMAERAKKDMLLFFADLDNMKEINDRLGHQEGDKALVEIATVLKEVFRESDIIGRMGGDEFAALAIDTTDETEEVLTARLQNYLDTHNKLETRNYALSLSIGIAHYDHGNPSSLDELMSRADTLMYEEKRKKIRIGSE
ncbi:MAG: diguanylate cyclase, partial [Proteobacteria bacterium]|nr:diguanylate cyclase [Pseudomonadota bacterium]